MNLNELDKNTLWRLFLAINTLLIITFLVFPPIHQKNWVWIIAVCFNFLYILTVFPIITDKIRKTWRYWQINVDTYVFDVESYVSRISNSIYIWNNHQTQDKRSGFWENQALTYIKEGDKVVFWVYGKPTGIYALGEVAGQPIFQEIPEDQVSHHLNKEGLTKKYVQVPIRITNNLFTNPISYKDTRELNISRYSNPIFSKLISKELPKTPGPLKIVDNEWSYEYTEGIIEEYINIPFKPITRDAWNQITTMIIEE